MNETPSAAATTPSGAGPPTSGASPPAVTSARRWRRRLGLAALAVVGLAVLGIVAVVARMAPIGAAYEAKLLASTVLVCGREPDSVRADELAGVSPLLGLCSAEVDREHQRVRASFLGLVEREAVLRPGLGTTIVRGELAVVPASAPIAPGDPAIDWPIGERVDLTALPAGVDRAALDAALDRAFSEPDPAAPRRTRAVVVAWRGRIVAERYAPGFGPATPQLGWSMTKTVVAALVGILVKDGRWALDRPVPVPEWSSPGDPRGAITLEQLLHMQSGLAWSEVYSPLTDVTSMLFEAPDAAAYAAEKPLAVPPGSAWSYSSGTTNILCRALQEELGPAGATFPHDALFAPLGLASALIERDSAGHLVGSSFGWATARDWARLGLLWVQDGLWRGQRILPDGWVTACRAPASRSSGRYGAHVWLDLEEGPPALPADAFHAAGHECQFTTMVPSRQLVVVRLGLTRQRRSWSQARLVADVLAALPAAP